MEQPPPYGRRIRELRARAGLSAVAFASSVEVHRHTVAKWEAGEHVPDCAALDRMRAAGYDWVYVVSGELGSEYASRLIDWSLIGSIATEVAAACKEMGVRLTVSEQQEVFRSVYAASVASGRLNKEVLDASLRLAA